MSQVILDMGSGNTCRNNAEYAMRMINTVAGIDAHRHEIIFKWQLFSSEPPNIPLEQEVFRIAYLYAKDLGYKTTSSVFDMRSLDFLMGFDIPFVKIACRPRIYWLIGEVPRRMPVIASYDGGVPDVTYHGVTWMYCVPKYPARKEDYLIAGPTIISDHSEGLDVWNECKPKIWEKHFILEDSPINPDAAGHAIKPDLLKYVIGETPDGAM